jgi:hypothetical protein
MSEQVKRKERLIYILLCLFGLLLSYGALATRDEAFLQSIYRRGFDPIGDTGALFMLVASILFFARYFKEKKIFRGQGAKANVIFLLLGLMFFFGAGEEANWGQNILGFQTPESVAKVNVEQDFNIHNLNFWNQKAAPGTKSTLMNVLNAQRLYNLFWLGFCVLLPLAAVSSRTAASWLKRFRVPLVPLFFGIFFLVDLGITKFFKTSVGLQLLGFRPTNLLDEMKETAYAFFFLLIAWYFFQEARKGAIRRAEDPS